MPDKIDQINKLIKTLPLPKKGLYKLKDNINLDDYIAILQSKRENKTYTIDASELGGSSTGIQSIQEGDNITIDNTDPLNPIVNASGEGSATIYYEKTFAELLLIINTNLLEKGAIYKITDRGDRGIILQALSDSLLSNSGKRIMLCPTFYGVGTDEASNNWIGVWNPTLSVAEDDLTIWGGLVWKNLTGNIGTAASNLLLDETNWVLVPKASFSNFEYTEKQFNVSYDFTTDYISKQWDEFGNVVGCPKLVADYIALYNPCDVTDWNLASLSPSFLFGNNECSLGVFNNSNITGNYGISNNTGIISGIIGNYNILGSDGIYNNRNFSSGITGNYNIGGVGISSNFNFIHGILNCHDIPNGIVLNSDVNGIEEFANTDNVSQKDRNNIQMQINLIDSPLIAGVPQYYSVICSDNSAITELVVYGEATGDAGAEIQIGIETDDEDYLPFTDFNTLNAGLKVSTLSSATNSTNRRIKIISQTGDIDGGFLNINIKTLKD